MNMEEHSEQQPAKKSQTDNCQEPAENGQGNDSNLAYYPEEMNKAPETLNMVMDLPLHCEVFKCLKQPIQRKFISGLGRGIYGIFSQKLLIEIRNPPNRWNSPANGLKAQERNMLYSYFITATNVYAEQAFPIQRCRDDTFQGTICYYYEIITFPAYREISCSVCSDPKF